MFNEYDRFILAKQINGENEIKSGLKGTVLLVLNKNPPVYEVEFVDNSGKNIGSQKTYTLQECDMLKFFE